MRQICPIRFEVRSDVGRRLGDSPAELEVQPEIPSGHGEDRYGVGDIAVHPEQIELQIQQSRIDGHARQANQLELAEAPQALPRSRAAARRDRGRSTYRSRRNY